MFHFVNKRKRFGFEKHPSVGYFGSGFTRDQKAAMAYGFLMILKTDLPLNQNMYHYAYKQLELIGFGIQSKYMEQYLDLDQQTILVQIKKLNLEQKKWFAKALHAMLYEIGTKPSFKHIECYLKIGKQTFNPFIK